MNELRWILLGVGVIIIALIYLWGMRGMIKERIRERRRRAAARLPENEPVLTAEEEPAQDLGKKPALSDPFAHQRLVDVEISPVRRAPAQPEEQPADEVSLAQSVETDAAEQPTRPIEKPEPVQAAPKPASKPAPAPVQSAPKPAKASGKTVKPRPEPEMTLLLTVIPHQGRLFSGQRIQAVAGELDLQLADNGLYQYCVDRDPYRPVFSVGHLREPGTFDLESLKSISTPGLLLFMRLPGPMQGVGAMERMVATAGKLADKLGGIVCDDRRNKMTNQELVHIRNQVNELDRRHRAWAPQHS